MAGIHRSSTLPAVIAVLAGLLGMAGIHRSSTLGRAELAEKQQVGAASLFRKARFGRGFLRVLAVFLHRTPPSCRTAGPSPSSNELAQAAE
jgi:hypothetical protein